MSQHQILFCTTPNKEISEKIAAQLVKDKLAACVNILPNITSVYEWQGEIEKTSEYLLLIKSHIDCYSKLKQTILRLHPYELPEIVAVDITRALPQYLQWINSCVLSK